MTGGSAQGHLYNVRAHLTGIATGRPFYTPEGAAGRLGGAEGTGAPGHRSICVRWLG